MSNDDEAFSDLWVRAFWVFVFAAAFGVAAIGFWFLKLVYFIAA